MTDVQEEEWLTSAELCAWLHIKRDWLYDRVTNREIPHHKIGRVLRFRKAEVEAWLQENKR